MDARTLLTVALHISVVRTLLTVAIQINVVRILLTVALHLSVVRTWLMIVLWSPYHLVERIRPPNRANAAFLSTSM